MELSGIFVKHILASIAIFLAKILTLISSWSISSKFFHFENHPKYSSAKYPLSSLNCLSIWAYPWGRSWRAAGRSIGEKLLSFDGVIAEPPRGTVELNDEGCLNYEVREDKVIAANKGWRPLYGDLAKGTSSAVALRVSWGWLFLLWESNEWFGPKNYVQGEGIFLVLK